MNNKLSVSFQKALVPFVLAWVTPLMFTLRAYERTIQGITNTATIVSIFAVIFMFVYGLLFMTRMGTLFINNGIHHRIVDDLYIKHRVPFYLSLTAMLGAVLVNHLKLGRPDLFLWLLTLSFILYTNATFLTLFVPASNRPEIGSVFCRCTVG